MSALASPRPVRVVAALCWCATLWSCGSSGAGAASTADAIDAGPSPEVGAPDVSPDPKEASASDASGADAADSAPPSSPDAGYAPTYRNSLRVCWNDAACTRAFAVSHGGDWSFTGPAYDSTAALQAAYANGADGVKIDVRFTSDDVAVLAHSSPLIFGQETLDYGCTTQKVEQMTAAQVTACHRFPGGETFQRVGDVLEALRGRLVVQLCVKESSAFARAIQEVLARNAQDFAFIEVNSPSDFAPIPAMPGADRVYFMVNVSSTPSDVDALLALHNPRLFMIEFDPIALSGIAATKLHPAGVRAFMYDSTAFVSQATLKAHFDDGADVVSSNVTAADVQARIQVNTSRGLSPP